MTDIDATLAEEALRIVNGDRQKAYDAPERNFHRIALAWEAITDRKYTAAEVGLMFVALKIVRESHQHQRDNFVDGIGYLLCAEAVTEKPLTLDDETLANTYTWGVYRGGKIVNDDERCAADDCGLVGNHKRDEWCPSHVGPLAATVNKVNAARSSIPQPPVISPGSTGIAFCKSPPCALPAHPESRTPHQERVSMTMPTDTTGTVSTTGTSFHEGMKEPKSCPSRETATHYICLKPISHGGNHRYF